MPQIIDERTLVGWLAQATARRTALLGSGPSPAIITYGDVEEHYVDEHGVVLRCDMTLKGNSRDLLTAEMKRPEVLAAAAPALIRDAYEKARGNGHAYFATCNFAEILLWKTMDGSRPQTPVIRAALAPRMTHSSQARARRTEIESNWGIFLDELEQVLSGSALRAAAARQALPPQVADLQREIERVAAEAAIRLESAIAADAVFRQTVIDAFSDQVGVELLLDQQRNPARFLEECQQVATIACFVVTMRLVMYHALNVASGGSMDPLALSPQTTDPARVRDDIASLLFHARRRTEDFELQLTPSDLDYVAFVSAPSEDVGVLWSRLTEVVRRSDWTGPAEYVPGLYESLLDDRHRHLMGVHYTPEAVAEVIAAYAVIGPADVVVDPACGAGTFVTLAAQRKRRLGSDHEQALEESYGVEIADFAASLAGVGLALSEPAAASAYPRIVKADFFTTAPGIATGLTLPGYGAVNLPEAFDAVIGNPPYVRFESRTAEERGEIYEVLRRRFARREIAYPNFTGKADLWAFFVAHAHQFLRPGGRLSFVLSWSLLCTDYGDAVMRFLARHFLIDAIVDSRVERFFAAKQNTVLLMARKATDHPEPRSSAPNPGIPVDHVVRFIRLKQPVDQLIDPTVDRGRRAEDCVDEMMRSPESDADVRWDVRHLLQAELSNLVEVADGEDDDEEGRYDSAAD